MPRRQFIRLTAYGAAAAGLAPTILAGCGGGDDAAEENGVKLSRPDAPVTLPTFDDISAIEDGLQPESGTLKVYNYEEYISPDVLAAFQDEFGVTVEVTTFTSMDEAVTRLASGEVAFDVFFPTPDRIGQLAAGQLLQPLNKSYLTNFENVWTSLRDPFYDQGSVYTVPYTLYTTGIGYRIDAVGKAPDAYDNPYDIFWDQANSGQVYLLEDDREVFGMALLRRDPEVDVNTEDSDLIAAALTDVNELTELVNVKVGAEAYTVLPEKRAWVHQCWSGDVINAQYYLPEGESIDNIGYWKSPTGVIGSDAIAVLRTATEAGARPYVLELHARPDQGDRELRMVGLPAAPDLARPELRRGRRLRAGPPRVGGRAARGLRRGPAAAPADARRREDVGQRLVAVHRRCVTHLRLGSQASDSPRLPSSPPPLRFGVSPACGARRTNPAALAGPRHARSGVAGHPLRRSVLRRARRRLR